MVVNNLVFAQDLAKPVQVRYLHGSLYEYDNNGLQLTVALYQDGEPVNAAGNISGTVLRSNGTMAAGITGSTSGNKASIRIPSGALMPGIIRIVVKSTQGSTKTTLLAVTGTVVMVDGSAYVDPASIIPDLTDYIALANDINIAAGNITETLEVDAAALEGDRYKITVSKDPLPSS